MNLSRRLLHPSSIIATVVTLRIFSIFFHIMCNSRISVISNFLQTHTHLRSIRSILRESFNVAFIVGVSCAFRFDLRFKLLVVEIIDTLDIHVADTRLNVR